MIPLQTRTFSCFFEVGTGFLRRVKSSEVEVIRTIYGAVRDKNWDTVEAQLRIEHLERNDDSFRLEFAVDHKSNSISFFWRGTIEGRGGVLEFRFDGRAETSFLRNRIGLCILHPILECAGKPCRIQHSDGTWEEGAFPFFISPHQPFKDLGALSWQPSDRLQANIQFEGEVFEMEDQRNWTDASFKTYSTPLELPFPVEISANEEVHQRVVLTLSDGGSAISVAEEPPVSISFLRESRPRTVPKIGLCAASHFRSLSSDELQYLARLRLNHLRTDIHFSRASWKTELRRTQNEARSVNARLQCALFLNDSAEQNLLDFRGTIEPGMVDICLIFHQAEKSTTSRWFELAERDLGPHGYRIGTGTNAYFTELNRQRPPRRAIACYSLNPQVHTFDDLSLVETLEAQPVTVESALQFCDHEVIISPVTLLPRFNPNATDPAQQREDPESSAADPRQSTLFCAAWTTGSLARLLPMNRLESVTYYETTGLRGVMHSAPHAQALGPTNLFPVYYVFEALAGARNLLPLSISQPALVAGLAFANERGVSTCLIANLTHERRDIDLRLPAERLGVLCLDETNLAEAGAGRLLPPSAIVTEAGHAKLNLAPNALLRLELQ